MCCVIGEKFTAPCVLEERRSAMTSNVISLLQQWESVAGCILNNDQSIGNPRKTTGLAIRAVFFRIVWRERCYVAVHGADTFGSW